MKIHSVVIVIALVLLGLLVPTGAVLQDPLFDDDHEIVLAPHEGPNGEYAQISDNDELRIDLSEPGVNTDGTTIIVDVFTISNHEEVDMEVWINHTASDRVTFQVAGESIQDPEDPLTLDANETQPVSLKITTHGTDVGEKVLSEFDISAHRANQSLTPTPSPTPTPTPNETTTPPPTTSPPPTTEDTPRAGPPAATPGPQTPPTPSTPEVTTPSTPETPTPTTPEAPPTESEVEVELGEPSDDAADPDPDDEEEEGVTIRDVDVSELEERERQTNVRTRPRAVADVQVRTTQRQSKQDRSRAKKALQAAGADSVTTVNEETTLSGTQSIVGTMDAIDRERKIVRAVDVQVPEERRNKPGTVRIPVSKAKLGTSDPAAARIGHLTDEGWQVLPTRVVRETENEFVFEARTPNFSPFAVFGENEVRYQWRIDELNRTFIGQEIRTKFSEPGIYNATLTVTNTFGEADSTGVRILANDEPEVEIEVEDRSNVTAGEPVTLRANVTDEVGNVTVTWTLPDGTRKVGTEIEQTFPAGEHHVSVEVEDEFGATGAAEQSIPVPPAEGGNPMLDQFGRDLPLELRLAFVGLLTFGLFVTLWWFVRRRSTISERPTRSTGVRKGLLPGWLLSFRSPVATLLGVFKQDPPRIVTFDTPSVDLAKKQFVIEELRIEDPAGNLETVDIVVTDSRGNEVAHKHIDLDGQPTYVSRSEAILPKSRVYVRDNDSYTFHITAASRNDRSDEQSRPRVSPERPTGSPVA